MQYEIPHTIHANEMDFNSKSKIDEIRFCSHVDNIRISSVHINIQRLAQFEVKQKHAMKIKFSSLSTMCLVAKKRHRVK